MVFQLTEEQNAIKSLARDFAANEISPFIGKYDEKESFPIEIMQKLHEYGLSNLAIPEQYGGPGIDKVSHALIVEEISKACAGVATGLEANSLSSYPILIGAHEELKQKYLPKLTEEGKLASLELTEPEAGSDVSYLTNTAKKNDDH